MTRLLPLAVLLLAVHSGARLVRDPHSQATPRARLTCLRGGAGADSTAPAGLLPAAGGVLRNLDAALPKMADAALAGLGLAGSFALMGALEPKLGLKLLVPPMMASGIIFFSPATPPSPKGFAAGTLGCATVSAAMFKMLSGLVSPAAAQGGAAGALLVWYKATGCIFPPAAVLCVLMAGVPAGQSPYAWVAAPWIAGHACLYGSALGVSIVRDKTRQTLNRRRLKLLAGYSTEELRSVFARFDTSKDGQLDASELQLALRVALSVDFSVGECRAFIGAADADGSNTLDFKEFQSIVAAKSK
jgi:hypothetical protein